MGRPLNKRYLGAPTAAGSEIKVQFNDGTGSTPGYIVKQLGSKRFRCSNAGGTIVADCILVDKASASIAANEMTITLQLDDTTVVQATKISGRKITADDGNTYPWNFSTSTTDGAAEIEEAGTAIGAGTDATLGTADDVLTGADDIEGDG